MNKFSIKNDIYRKIVVGPNEPFNPIYNNMEIYQKMSFSNELAFLGFYKRVSVNSNKVYYEFEDYDNNTSCVCVNYDEDPFYFIYVTFYVLYVDPPKMTDKMKGEIKYHPYNLFVQKNIENHLGEETKRYFSGNIYMS